MVRTHTCPLPDTVATPAKPLVDSAKLGTVTPVTGTE